MHFQCHGYIFELLDENREYWECYFCKIYDHIATLLSMWQTFLNSLQINLKE